MSPPSVESAKSNRTQRAAGEGKGADDHGTVATVPEEENLEKTIASFEGAVSEEAREAPADDGEARGGADRAPGEQGWGGSREELHAAARRMLLSASAALERRVGEDDAPADGTSLARAREGWIELEVRRSISAKVLVEAMLKGYEAAADDGDENCADCGMPLVRLEDAPLECVACPEYTLRLDEALAAPGIAQCRMLKSLRR